MKPFQPSTRALAALLGALCLCALPAPAAQERDTTSILEEQELLRRQLQRLKRTMEALVPRLEKEGRPRALELLKDGLKMLDQRSDGSGQLTLEELMDRAREDVQAGQVATSIQRQEQIIANLERLLSVLLDRQNVENLERSLEELAQVKQDLAELSSQERALRERTEQLREQSRNDAQRKLEAELARIAEEQRKLLEQNERAGRESGALALEQIAKELETLRKQQETDAAVLESWKPASSERLEQAARERDTARRDAARAARLQQAAEELRRAATEARERS